MKITKINREYLVISIIIIVSVPFLLNAVFTFLYTKGVTCPSDSIELFSPSPDYLFTEPPESITSRNNFDTKSYLLQKIVTKKNKGKVSFLDILSITKSFYFLIFAIIALSAIASVFYLLGAIFKLSKEEIYDGLMMLIFPLAGIIIMLNFMSISTLIIDNANTFPVSVKINNKEIYLPPKTYTEITIPYGTKNVIILNENTNKIVDEMKVSVIGGIKPDRVSILNVLNTNNYSYDIKGYRKTY